MHATTEQLLTIRDGQPEDVEVKCHVDSCSICQEKMRYLAFRREQLNALASAASDKDFAFNEAWQKLSEKAEQQIKQKSIQKKRWLGALSIAASLVLTLVLSNQFLPAKTVKDDLGDNGAQDFASLHQNSSADQNLGLEAVLIQRNNSLEQALRDLPQPRRVVRGGTAASIASLEDQIALVDYGLTYAEQAGIDENGSIGLLQNRADLMASLYQVRYSQALASYAY